MSSTPSFRRGAVPLALLLAWLLLAAAPASACVESNCMTIWSTADGNGDLTIDWDFTGRGTLQTFKAICAAGQCLYSTVDPGLLAESGAPRPGFFPLANGTPVDLILIAADAAASLKINGATLASPGDHIRLGSAGTLHAHPAWQLKLPERVEGDYALSFRLTSTALQYRQSPVFTVLLTNRRPPTETPTPVVPTSTPTPTATPRPPCAGDCDGDRTVTVSELIGGVASALGGPAPCAALDRDGDGHATVAELVAAVSAALAGCSGPPPTETPGSTLAAIQAAVFSPRCAIATCHDRATAAGELVLEGDTSYAALVGVVPAVEAAATAGQLRVAPGNPDGSFLLTKLAGPPRGQGSRMPLSGEPLGDAEFVLIRDWILAGAPR